MIFLKKCGGVWRELGWELWAGKVVLGWWGKWVGWRVWEVRFDWGVGGGGDYDQPWGLYVLEIVLFLRF